MRNTLAKKKQRIVFIDYLRVFSCLSVIMIHVLASARTVFPDHTMFEELLCKVLPYMMYYAVPVFFMITGYLFYSKEIKMSYGDFFKKYVLKYIVAVFVFGFGYAVLEEVFNKNYSLTMPFTALLNTLLGKTWAHMWYLYGICLSLSDVCSSLDPIMLLPMTSFHSFFKVEHAAVHGVTKSQTRLSD